jgi:peptide/nickel transport system permease protein
MLAIGIANCPGISRIVRSATLSVRNEEFVLAAEARGESHLYIMFSEIFPNILPPTIIEGTIRMVCDAHRSQPELSLGWVSSLLKRTGA